MARSDRYTRKILTSGDRSKWSDLYISDNNKIILGVDSDLQIYHDGSNSWITNFTGDLKIYNNADDGDIIFASDDGSGGVATYMTVDGSTGYVRFEDNRRIAVGSSDDFMIYHDGADTKLSNVTGTLQFHQNVNDSDIMFFCDDGSGGTTAYITLDGSAAKTKFSKFTLHQDNVKAEFGDGADLQIYHDGTHGQIVNNSSNLYIKNNANDSDIVFQSDDGSGGTETYFFLDGSSGGGNAQTIFPDNSYLLLGTGSDLELFHNGTNSYIDNNTGDLYIRQEADDKDIVFRCDDGSGGSTTYMQLDGSHKRVVFPNDIQATFGSSSRLSIKHDGTDATIMETQGDLKLINTADDKDIIFQSDDGSGNTTTYFALDGSESYVKFYKDAVFVDNEKVKFGTGLDLEIYHDGSNSYINQRNTGDLIIQASSDDKDIIFKSDDGSGGTTAYITLDGSEGEIHFHKTVGVGTTNPDTAYKLDIAGKAQVQSALELDDVLTLNAISTPSDPEAGKSSIYMDAADGGIKVKINLGGTVVTRTIASYE